MKNKFIVIVIIMFHSICYGAVNVKTQEITTDYGIKLWLVEDHTNPVISMVVSFNQSGYAYDSKEGESSLVAKLLNEGAGEYSANQIAEITESNGIIINFTSRVDNFTAHLKTLPEHFETSVKLLSQMFTDPRFDEEDVNRVKAQQLVEIKQIQEKPNLIAKKKFLETIFDNHPYSKSSRGDELSIADITRDDLLHYVRNNFSRLNLNIVVSGDITEPVLREVLDQYFISLPLLSEKGKKIAKLANKVKMPPSNQLRIDMDIPQSVVYFGKSIISPDHPDFYPFYVLNHIIGGSGLNSLLISEIRKQRGLAYRLATWFENYQYAGLLVGASATENKSVPEMIIAIKKVLDSVKRDGVTLEVLQGSKEYIISSFVMGLTTNSAISSVLSYAQSMNLGSNYIQQFCNKIEQVTLQDIQRVSGVLLNTDNMLFVVVGKQNDRL